MIENFNFHLVEVSQAMRQIQEKTLEKSGTCCTWFSLSTLCVLYLSWKVLKWIGMRTLKMFPKEERVSLWHTNSLMLYPFISFRFAIHFVLEYTYISYHGYPWTQFVDGKWREVFVDIDAAKKWVVIVSSYVQYVVNHSSNIGRKLWSLFCLEELPSPPLSTLRYSTLYTKVLLCLPLVLLVSLIYIGHLGHFTYIMWL